MHAMDNFRLKMVNWQGGNMWLEELEFLIIIFNILICSVFWKMTIIIFWFLFIIWHVPLRMLSWYFRSLLYIQLQIWKHDNI